MVAMVIAVFVLAVVVVLRLRRWLFWLAVVAALGIGVPGLILSMLFGVVRLRASR